MWKKARVYRRQETNRQQTFVNIMTKLLDVIEPESNTRKDGGLRIRVAGALVLRYGLVLVIGWIGLMKFTGYEAKGIEPLVAHSPFMSWMYSFLSVQTFSDALGVVEVTIAILIGLRHWSALGSAAAVIMFLTTLSSLVLDTRVGAEPGWVSVALGASRTVPFERRSIAGSSTLVVW